MGATPSEEVNDLLETTKMKMLAKKKSSTTDCDEVLKIVGAKIANARKEKGMSQTEFAKLIGLSRGRLSVIETTGVNAVDTLCHIAKITEKKIGWFFGEEQPKTDLYSIVKDVVQVQVAETMKKQYGENK